MSSLRRVCPVFLLSLAICVLAVTPAYAAPPLLLDAGSVTDDAGVIGGDLEAVESAINALEVHGLDRCPDHGIAGFRRYVALAVVARNIHRIGAILHEKQSKRAQRNARALDRDRPFPLAA